MSFDKDAIVQLTKAEAITAAAAAVTGQVETLVALPIDFSLHDLEKYLFIRRRARGTMSTSSVPDFAAYVMANKENGAAAFVNQKQMAAMVVLNLGDPAQPGHCDNLAKLTPEQTAAYKALLAVAATGAQAIPLTQKTAAEFLEDWRTFIKAYNGEEEVDLTKAIAAVRKITIEGLQRRDAEEKQLSANRTTFESIEAKSTETLPTAFTFACMPYQGLSARTFRMRLGILTSEKDPKLTLRIINHEQHAEEMAAELADLVRAALQDQLPVLVGTYAVGS